MLRPWHDVGTLMFQKLLGAFVVCALAGCAAHPALPANVSLGDSPALPSPRVAAANAAPKILAVALSSNDVRPGQTWSGRIITSTNVASLEIRTNLFSLNVPRRTFGDFSFLLRIYDVPPIFVRGYDLRIIARNTAGASVEEDLPFRIR
jgi:hypothetical protein